jgi:hypothetical protein
MTIRNRTLMIAGSLVVLAAVAVILTVLGRWEIESRPGDSQEVAKGGQDAGATRPASPAGTLPSGQTGAGDPSLDDLPSVASDTDVELAFARAVRKRIWTQQDEAMATWPKFEAVRSELLAELGGAEDPAALSTDALVNKANNLRQAFWNAGGNESREAYRHAYKARILLEVAHEKDASNDVVTNELVETIQAAHPMITGLYGEPSVNFDVIGTLLSLRREQFDRIRREIEQGRTPTRGDFVTGFDVAYLTTHGKTRDFKLAVQTADWLLSNSKAGGWDKYDSLVSQVRERAREGSSLGANIYVCQFSTQEDLARYARRSPSFTGPDVERRNVQLWGIDTLPAGADLRHGLVKGARTIVSKKP